MWLGGWGPWFWEPGFPQRPTDCHPLPAPSGALLKPWLFTEIKEQRHWDISSSERLDILRDFTHYGLEHWGSDTQGVEKTRRFLLEWLSFLCRWDGVAGRRGGPGAVLWGAPAQPLSPRPHRYVPVGLLERLPQRINERPPYYLGRDYLETLMASQKAADWIRIRCPGAEALWGRGIDDLVGLG